VTYLLGTEPVQPSHSEERPATTDDVCQDWATQPRRVLLVDDNDINALVAQRMLEKLGCDVAVARDAREAVAICTLASQGTTPDFDLILMDVHMPDIDGFEAAKLIRDLYGAASREHPPIAALTANAFAEDRQRCLDAGLDDYLAKPFERHEIEALLDKWSAVRGSPTPSGQHFAA
jgi:CheY-like chemotaxis protein